MQPRKIKVYAIAPYEGLKNLLSSISQEEEYDNFTISVEEGDLDRGLELAKKAEKEGYDIILSRGGTAKMIMENISIPVFGIDISGYDILRTIKLAEGYKGKKAVIGFESVTSGYRSLCALLQVDTDIHIYTISSQDEAITTLKKLKQLGVGIIIGDVITCSKAKEMGMNSMLITSGEESIRETFGRINAYCRMIYQNWGRQYIFERIMGAEFYGVFVFDGNAQLIYSFCPDEAKGLVSQLEQRLRVDMAGGKSSMRIDGRDATYRVNALTFDDFCGRVLTAFVVEAAMPKVADKAFAVVDEEELSRVSPNLVSSLNAEFSEILRNIVVISQTSMPVLIEGERGTEKDAYARQIYWGKGECAKPLFEVDCKNVSDNELSALIPHLTPGDSPHKLDERYERCLNAGSGIYLKHINKLSEYGQKAILSCMGALTPRRVIASSEVSLFSLVEAGLFSRELYDELNFVKVRIPPLRQRKEDIENLSSVLISQANELCGKQIVGVDEEGMELLRENEWRGNTDEFEAVIVSAVKATITPYISKQTLAAFVSSNEAGQPALEIMPNKTLDEINRDIIMAVLKEENMNQARAAKRLGISRTTLWRKIQ